MPLPPSAGATHSAPITSPSACRASLQRPWWECIYRSESGESLPYFLFVPAAAVADSPNLDGYRFPLVVFLHGSSGSGGGDKALRGSHRFGSALWISDRVQARYPSVVVVPQAEPAPGETWVRAWRPPPPGDAQPKEALVLVLELLESLTRELPVDKKRWYLTGQSMGGFGAWLSYTRYPGRFAAIIPVCGGGDPASVIPNATPVWAFHGDRDTVVPANRSREMVDAIRSAAGSVRYTEYPGMGHNIFEAVYAEPELADWLFSQRLP